MSIEMAAKEAAAISASGAYQEFLETIRQKFPWRFRIPMTVLERDYLRIVDHHLRHLIPRVRPYIGAGVRRVLDFGCGSGGSAIALAMVCPNVYCYGIDIDSDEITVSRERAKLYRVADRCDFQHVSEGQPLPFHDNFFDFCQCSSVLEYALGSALRKFCIQEMLRLVKPDGLLFFSVPNRVYPFEVHTSKWGWNYFPQWLQARIVDSNFWEVRKLAKPTIIRLYRTPILQLFTPWSNFCVRKQSD